jgi:hypothetical protein
MCFVDPLTAFQKTSFFFIILNIVILLLFFPMLTSPPPQIKGVNICTPFCAPTGGSEREDSHSLVLQSVQSAGSLDVQGVLDNVLVL